MKGVVRPDVEPIALEHNGRVVVSQKHAARSQGIHYETFKQRRNRRQLGVEPAGTYAGIVFFYEDELHVIN